MFECVRTVQSCRQGTAIMAKWGATSCHPRVMWGWVTLIGWQMIVQLIQISNHASFVQQSCGQSKPSVCDTSGQNKPVELCNQLQSASAFVHVGVGIVSCGVFFLVFALFLLCMCAGLHKADKEEESYRMSVWGTFHRDGRPPAELM